MAEMRKPLSAGFVDPSDCFLSPPRCLFAVLEKLNSG